MTISSKNRWDLIEEMLKLAVKNKDVSEENHESVKKALIEREKSMSTGIGRGVAIPHCSTPYITEIVLILAFCHEGIDFQSIDNLPVNIAICLLVPKTKLKQHIKTLANIARVMNDDELRERLLTMKTPESVIKAIKDYETSLKR